jgi:hypothetical protein
MDRRSSRLIMGIVLAALVIGAAMFFIFNR